MALFTSNQPLGRNQIGVLRALADNGPYVGHNGPWYWTNASTTSRILISLAHRGLVIANVDAKGKHVRSASINDFGRAALAAALETEKS